MCRWCGPPIQQWSLTPGSLSFRGPRIAVDGLIQSLGTHGAVRHSGVFGEILLTVLCHNRFAEEDGRITYAAQTAETTLSRADLPRADPLVVHAAAAYWCCRDPNIIGYKPWASSSMGGEQQSSHASPRITSNGRVRRRPILATRQARCLHEDQYSSRRQHGVFLVDGTLAVHFTGHWLSARYLTLDDSVLTRRECITLMAGINLTTAAGTVSGS